MRFEKAILRRSFLERSLTAAAALGFPSVVPARVFGPSAPNNLIQVGQIGCGRIARVSEFPGILRNSDVARYVAVCDLDSIRLADAKSMLEQAYAKKFGAGNYAELKTYGDYREMLQDKSIDAVAISTPDHWHAQIAMEAALAGKDIYLQKPASNCQGRPPDGRHPQADGRIFQQGSQQRSDYNFRMACELIRNGRIGKIQQVLIGLPVDPSGIRSRKCPSLPAWITIRGLARRPWCTTRKNACTRRRRTLMLAMIARAGCAVSSSARA